ncbi:hypothetical protein [Marinimicrobium locisalis]|uniref:hypothetical protein n=1 Tax=Marinimicrobium locisalis TaxID=546022 RepID=UPI003221BF5A
MKNVLLLLLFPLQSLAQPGLSHEMEEAFTAFFSEPNEARWERIIEVGDKTDGSFGLEFSLWCFEIIENRPLALYNIYLSGDDRAIVVQAEAFSYDFSAFNIDPNMAEMEILPVYSQYLSKIESLSTEGYSPQELSRHKLFLGLATGELAKWKYEWKNFLD